MHRAMGMAMQRLAGTIVVAGFVLAACGSDSGSESESGSSESTAASTVEPTVAVTTTDEPDPSPAPSTTESEPSTTEPPDSTAPETTAAPGTTVEPAPTTTEPPPTTAGEPVLNGIDPACAEAESTEGAANAVTIGDTFGPLEVEPALSIELPAARSESDPGLESPAASGLPLEVGLLVGVRAPFAEFEGSKLSLVDWDGETRWVTCTDQNFRSFFAAPAAERVLVEFTTPDTFVPSWFELVVETGELTPTTLPIDSDASLYVWNERIAVFGPSAREDIDPATDLVHIVDLQSLAFEEVGFPDGFPAVSLDSGMFELTDGNELMLLSREGGVATVIAVRVGDEWSSDPADLAEAYGVRPAFFFDDAGPSIIGTDATGATVWESGVTPISAEGFIFGRSRDVTIVAGCWDPLADGEEFCNRSEVGGLDSATGVVLWRLENDRGIEVISDGFAIVTSGDDSGRTLMIDTNTGEAVPGQEWDEPGLFFTGCCDDQFNSATRHGGTVVTVHDRELKVFLPE